MRLLIISVKSDLSKRIENLDSDLESLRVNISFYSSTFGEENANRAKHVQNLKARETRLKFKRSVLNWIIIKLL
jgi:hypothetical protein